MIVFKTRGNPLHITSNGAVKFGVLTAFMSKKNVTNYRRNRIAT